MQKPTPKMLQVVYSTNDGNPGEILSPGEMWEIMVTAAMEDK